MIDFTSGESMISSANLNAFTSVAVIGWAMKVTSITQGTIFDNSTGRWNIYLASNKLYFRKKETRHEDEGLWSWPVSANTNYQFALLYDHNSNESYDPVVYANGSLLTMTEETAPTGLTADIADILFVGGSATYTDPLQGYMGDVWLYNGSMTAAQLIRATSNRIYGYAMQFGSNLQYSFFMNEYPDNTAIASSNTILPNGDVSMPWTSATYTNINATDDTKAHADDTDDNQEIQFDLGTFTIPSGETVIGFKETFEISGSSITMTLKYKRGGDGAFTSIGSATSPAIDTFYSFRSFQALTQTQIDGMQGAVLVGTIASSDDAYCDYVDIKVFSTKYFCRDRKAGSVTLVGFTTSSGGPKGNGDSWMAYP